MRLFNTTNERQISMKWHFWLLSEFCRCILQFWLFSQSCNYISCLWVYWPSTVAVYHNSAFFPKFSYNSDVLTLFCEFIFLTFLSLVRIVSFCQLWRYTFPKYTLFLRVWLFSPLIFFSFLWILHFSHNSDFFPLYFSFFRIKTLCQLWG